MNYILNQLNPTCGSEKKYDYNPVQGFHPAAGSVDFPASGGIDFGSLSPILRTLLVSDGTVTKFLEAYYWEPIQVKVLFHKDFEVDDLPEIEVKKGSHVLHRRVTLCGIQTGNIYCYALSYIRADLLWPGVRDDLIQGRLGIGELLRDKRVETYRQLLTYEMVAAGELAADLGIKADDQLISRSYRIFVNRTPCFYIIEKFPTGLFS